MVAVDNSGLWRIRWTNPKPSIPGICMSARANLYGLPASLAAKSSARASSAPCTKVGFIFHRPSIPSRIRRFVWLSSTTSIFTSRNSGGTTLNALVSMTSAMPRDIVKWNLLPRPGSLSTQIFPPIMATNRAEIVSPRPVPPYFLVVEESAWENESKIDLCLSLGIPIPVSDTVNCKMQLCPASATV